MTDKRMEQLRKAVETCPLGLICVCVNELCDAIVSLKAQLADANRAIKKLSKGGK